VSALLLRVVQLSADWRIDKRHVHLRWVCCQQVQRCRSVFTCFPARWWHLAAHIPVAVPLSPCFELLLLLLLLPPAGVLPRLPAGAVRRGWSCTPTRAACWLDRCCHTSPTQAGTYRCALGVGGVGGWGGMVWAARLGCRKLSIGDMTFAVVVPVLKLHCRQICIICRCACLTVIGKACLHVLQQCPAVCWCVKSSVLLLFCPALAPAGELAW
jgi:hypothetical protein